YSGWFHLTGKVPESWQGLTVVAKLNFGGEALIFDEAGCPIYGLTNGSVFGPGHSKDIYRLFEPCKGAEEVDLWIEAAANPLMGITPENENFSPVVKDMKLATFNEELWQLWIDIEVLSSLIKSLPESSVRRSRILRTLNQMIDFFGNTPEKAKKCRKILKPLFDAPAYHSDLTAVSVGHAHIDTGWRWPVRESIRKCARTFASQLDLMDRYPQYVFGASQAQHYQFVKDYYPDLYEKIKARIKEGRWEVQGATWVENDMNLVSGESLVRQFLHGKNFYMDEFGVDIQNLWLPDVFGYSSALPQIMKKSGVDYFLTIKISWSQFNKFPHTTFKWRGIDGSEVITHFPPDNSYNSVMIPSQGKNKWGSSGLVGSQGNFAEKDLLDEFMVLFGIGDGGGGPREDYIERGLRMQNLEGVPKVKFEMASDFFKDLQKKEKELEIWDGELYLELHRGTYTTQAEIKKGNRCLESKLVALEFICSALPSKQYPRKELDRIWKNMLMNQFHDIIPGSSIKMVNDEAKQDYKKNLLECEKLANLAAEKLFEKDSESIVLFNSLSWNFSQPISLPENCKGYNIKDDNGNFLPIQNEPDGTFVMLNVPPHSFVALTKSCRTSKNEASLEGLVLENDLVKYEFNENGELVKAFDKEEGRDILQNDKKGNIFSLYVDRPNAWDAWDIDFFYEEQFIEHPKGKKISGIKGGILQNLKFQLKIGKSRILQTISLATNTKRLDFATNIDWKEKHHMLRVEFPTSVSCLEFTCDIQYGYLKRSTHRNTSWDMAKFEVCAQKYVDISLPDYGVALLNDCKYGHKIHDNVIDLNLLRSPTNPDPDADIGQHEFTYSLLPHSGDLINSDVIPEAEMLNRKPMIFDGFKIDKIELPCKLVSDNITLEVMKRAEKDNCHVIRLVERHGKKAIAEIRLKNKKIKLIETDLLEWKEIASFEGNIISIPFKPFEIRTFKIQN
ncbi:MAG: glycoside hydrolase family 38 C-terminal domain-containing protein, partial [Verrucomicrobiota bacterium]|nr:glycoside hydrolase family 38 C-terminal domain-containing protein [Verrucomicrobiota bacterium]